VSSPRRAPAWKAPRPRSCGPCAPPWCGRISRDRSWSQQQRINTLGEWVSPTSCWRLLRYPLALHQGGPRH